MSYDSNMAGAIKVDARLRARMRQALMAESKNAWAKMERKAA